MTVKDLLNHLNKLPDESLDMNARVVTNCGKHRHLKNTSEEVDE